MKRYKVQVILLFEVPAEDTDDAYWKVHRWTDGMNHMVGAPIDTQIGVLNEDEDGYVTSDRKENT